MVSDVTDCVNFVLVHQVQNQEQIYSNQSKITTCNYNALFPLICPTYLHHDFCVAQMKYIADRLLITYIKVIQRQLFQSEMFISIYCIIHLLYVVRRVGNMSMLTAYDENPSKTRIQVPNHYLLLWPFMCRNTTLMCVQHIGLQN